MSSLSRVNYMIPGQLHAWLVPADPMFSEPIYAVDVCEMLMQRFNVTPGQRIRIGLCIANLEPVLKTQFPGVTFRGWHRARRSKLMCTMSGVALTVEGADALCRLREQHVRGRLYFRSTRFDLQETREASPSACRTGLS
jgi:hypothetical protein